MESEDWNTSGLDIRMYGLDLESVDRVIGVVASPQATDCVQVSVKEMPRNRMLPVVLAMPQ